MAPHSSTLAWKIPWMEEPGRLQSMGSLRVGHNWETSLSLFTFMHWRRKWQPTPVFLPGESQGPGSLVGFRYGVAQSQTRLKRLSSSSSSSVSKSQCRTALVEVGLDYLVLALPLIGSAHFIPLISLCRNVKICCMNLTCPVLNNIHSTFLAPRFN